MQDFDVGHPLGKLSFLPRETWLSACASDPAATFPKVALLCKMDCVVFYHTTAGTKVVLVAFRLLLAFWKSGVLTRS